jgi:hypothetical protein
MNPAADAGTPLTGNFTVVVGISPATAQLLGLIVLGLFLMLLATKLTGDQLTVRRNEKKAAAGKPGRRSGGVRKRLRLRHPRQPSGLRPAVLLSDAALAGRASH